ncbi:MAG: methylglyoxal synthase [Bacteroidales bacterium]
MSLLKIKQIALVAHDNQKKDLKEWVEWNREILLKHRLVCTGTTGRIVQETLRPYAENRSEFDNQFTRLKSGPLGGDQQLGSMIVNGLIDMLIFFWDPMQPQPHDVDVKALLRITALYNIPTACNRSTADFLISSPLMNESYKRIEEDYSEYINRVLIK